MVETRYGEAYKQTKLYEFDKKSIEITARRGTSHGVQSCRVKGEGVVTR